MGAGFGQELLPQTPHEGKERAKRSPSPEDGEDVMVDIEGDGTDEQDHHRSKQGTIRSELEAAAQQSEVVGEAQQPCGRLPPALISQADMDIVLVANITNQYQPVKEQLLHRGMLDRLSKTFSEDKRDDESRDRCTMHTAMSKKPHPIFMGQTLVPCNVFL